MADIPLKEHIEAQIASLDRYFDARLEAVKSEIHKAERELSLRLQGMNEFRDALKDQTATLVTRTEMDLRIEAINRRLNSLELKKAKFDGELLVLSALVAIVASALVTFILQHLKLA